MLLSSVKHRPTCIHARTLKGRRRIDYGASVQERATTKFLRGLQKHETGCWSCTTIYVMKAGDCHLQITEDGKQYQFKLHRFSFEHFVGSIPDEMCVCHKCDNRWCCNPDHLFLGTQRDNVHDMHKKGRAAKNTILSNAIVLKIYRDLADGIKGAEVARQLGVQPQVVYAIAKGRNWKHLYTRFRHSEPE